MTTRGTAIGVDLGGSSVRVAQVGVPGLRSRSVDRSTTVDRLLEHLTDMAPRPAERAGGRVVVAVPTYVAADGTLLDCPSIPALTGVPLAALVSDALHADVEVLPDLACAVVGEHDLGVGRGSERFICVALGTGANAAAVVDGSLLRTAYGCLGEAGHVLVEPDGPECPCGGHGCLEAVASGWALGREAARLGLDGPPALTAAAQGGDAAATAALARAGRALGRAISTWSVMIWPDTVAVAGGVAAAGELLLAPARAELKRVAPPYVSSRIEVRPAELGHLATMAGALLEASHGDVDGVTATLATR